MTINSFRSKEDDVMKSQQQCTFTTFLDESTAMELFSRRSVLWTVVDSFTQTTKPRRLGDLVLFDLSFVFIEERILVVKNGESIDNFPSIVIRTTLNSLVSSDFSNSLFGRVKEFAVLANIKNALANEGFADIIIKYLGEFWIMVQFPSQDARKSFRDNVNVGSWFSILKNASSEFHCEKRIAWVETEGIPFKLWTENTFKRIASRWGVFLSVDDQEDSCYHSKRLCVHTANPRSISKDFKIIFRGKQEKASWLIWNNVLMSKDRGGLGVSSLYAINRGLLVKWVWRFVTQKDSLWPRSIKAIHGSSIQSGLQAKKEHNSCWRSITKELGDGKASKFWCDSWSDEGVLKEKFPRVYALELRKNITIADKVRQENPCQDF
ncbi:nucleotide-binding alpha-beta plait domain-containing protein [Tanacetum coccineum]